MVHQYKLNGYNIVLDTHSGSVHVVDSLAYDLIELYGQALELSGNAEFESLCGYSYMRIQAKSSQG